MRNRIIFILIGLLIITNMPSVFGDVFITNDLTTGGDTSSNAFNARSIFPQSITLGLPPDFTIVLSAVDFVIGPYNRKLLQIDQSVGIVQNRDGSIALGVRNDNDSTLALTAVTVANYLSDSIAMFKFGDNFIGLNNTGLLGNEGGDFLLSNTRKPYPTQIRIVYHDDPIAEPDLDIIAIPNITDIITIDDHNATNPYLTTFNYDVLMNLYKVKATKTDNQSIVNGGTWVNITFDSEDFDVGDMHSTGSGNETITIQKDINLYAISYHIKIDSSDKSTYETRVLRNGTVLGTLCDIGVGSKESSFLTLSSNYNLYNLTTGDELVLQVSHDDANPQLVYGSNSYFQVVEVL